MELIYGISSFPALQASRGITTLAVAYFGYDDLPRDPTKIDLELFEEAVDIVTSMPNTVPDRCGVWSSCIGSIFGLLLGIHCNKVKAVASVNGAVIPFGTQVRFRGEVLTAPMIKLASKHMNFDKDLVAWPRHDVIANWLSRRNNNAIHAGGASNDTRFLMITTADCAFGGPMHAKVFKDLSELHGNINVEHLKYDYGGHIIEPPYSSFNSYVYNPYWPYREGGPELPTPGCNLASGGSVEDNYRVMEDMWSKILRFVYKNVRDDSVWYQETLQKTKEKTKAAAVAAN